MKTKQLIFMDQIFKIIILFFIFFFKKISNRNFISDKILVIKLIGAGNFFAIDDVLPKKKVKIITTFSNIGALNKLGIKPDNIYIIRTNNIYNLLKSSLLLIAKLFRENFEIVINLETHSNFAKLLSVIPNSKKICGLTNMAMDKLSPKIYDLFLFDSQNLNGLKDTLNLFVNGFKETQSKKMNIFIKHQQFISKKFFNKIQLNKVLFAPSCSDLDISRRVDINFWLQCSKLFKKVSIVLPENDPEFNIFSKYFKNSSNVNVIATSYHEFIKFIKNSDLIITVDSQALHIAQKFKKKTIAFFSSTDPTSINIYKKTFPITKSLICSPCVHQYISKPCGNKNYCNKFNKHHYNLIKNLVNNNF